MDLIMVFQQPPQSLVRTEVGRRCLALTSRLYPAALPMVWAVLAADMASAGTHGWSWGVWCAYRTLKAGAGQVPIDFITAAKLAAAVDQLTHLPGDQDLLEFQDLEPVNYAEQAIAAEESRDTHLSGHREASAEALRAMQAGKEAGMLAWANETL